MSLDYIGFYLKNMNDYCHKKEVKTCCDKTPEKKDYFLIITTILIILSYFLHLFLSTTASPFLYLSSFTSAVYSFVNTMAIGIAIGIIFIGLLGQIPREFIIAILGKNNDAGGVIRATFAGVLLDLCSHGILMVGAKLYERGASLGQVMAFLIASPWNSISLTIILWALVGFKWMMVFLITSMIIGVISGLIFDLLVKTKRLPENPNRVSIPDNFKLIPETKSALKEFKFSFTWLKNMLIRGLKDSRMVIRWIFFGIILAASIRTFISLELFQTYFGPTLAGLGLTLIIATILEVCSEGTVPVAADLINRANAPGNSFTFLMAGVATDYTEIMVLREVTGKWIIPLFVPLVTLPQILCFALIFNHIKL